MTVLLSEDDVIITVTRLTRSQLGHLIELEFIKPQRHADGYVFRPVDIARLELLCDLHLDLGLDETALGIVISLIDQLHDARQDLAVLARAVRALPEEERASIVATLRSSSTERDM